MDLLLSFLLSYNDCMATIRRAPSVDHHFELVITKVYEDGDQDLLEDEDESESRPSSSKYDILNARLADAEKSFLISEELEFRAGETDGEPNFVWRDLQGDIDEFYEFVATGTNAPTRAFFETCMYRAMYERKYKASADSISDATLEQFVWRCVTLATFPANPSDMLHYIARLLLRRGNQSARLISSRHRATTKVREAWLHRNRRKWPHHRKRLRNLSKRILSSRT